MKHGELARELGVSTIEIMHARKRVCDEDDYNTKSKQISRTGATKIREHFSVPFPECPVSAPDTPQLVLVRVVAPCFNPRFVRCVRIGEEHKGAFPVGIPQRLASNMSHGRQFKAHVVYSNGEPYYRHETLERQ